MLGAGVMGAGITSTVLGHGLPVVLVETDAPRRDRARDVVARQLRHAQLAGALAPDAPTGELTTAADVDAAAGSTVVIEAITERADAKADALRALCSVLDPTTPIITNTSSIPVDELAAAADDPGRVIGTHFMNPPYLITQVEVVRGPRTAETTLAAVTTFLAALGRQAIVVRDTPGFVTSRLLHPMINDAARIVGEGIATADEVDALMQGCLGHPTGPLRTADLIGLDNLADSLDRLYERTGEERYRPCPTLREKVRLGDHGRKTGRGFHDYGKALP